MKYLRRWLAHHLNPDNPSEIDLGQVQHEEFKPAPLGLVLAKLALIAFIVSGILYMLLSPCPSYYFIFMLWLVAMLAMEKTKNL